MSGNGRRESKKRAYDRSDPSPSRSSRSKARPKHDPRHQPQPFIVRNNLTKDIANVLTGYGACLHYNALKGDQCNKGENCKLGHWCSTDLQGTRKDFVLGDRVNLSRDQARKFREKKESEAKKAKEEALRATEEKIAFDKSVREDNQSTRANRNTYLEYMNKDDPRMYELMFREIGPGELGEFHFDNQHDEHG